VASCRTTTTDHSWTGHCPDRPPRAIRSNTPPAHSKQPSGPRITPRNRYQAQPTHADSGRLSVNRPIPLGGGWWRMWAGKPKAAPVHPRPVAQLGWPRRAEAAAWHALGPHETGRVERHSISTASSSGQGSKPRSAGSNHQGCGPANRIQPAPPGWRDGLKLTTPQRVLAVAERQQINCTSNLGLGWGQETQPRSSPTPAPTRG